MDKQEGIDWCLVREQMDEWIADQEAAGAVWIEPEAVVERMAEVVEAQLQQQRAS